MNFELAAGDYIIDSSYIYKVTAVKEDEDNGAMYVYYEPTSGTDKVFTASIPLKNFKLSGIRKVLTTGEIAQILKDLKSKTSEDEYDIIRAKEEFYSNNPQRMVSVLIFYWKNILTLNKNDANLVEQILEHLCQEISLVTKKDYAVVREDVKKILDKRN